jgi:prephenate dehydrogenase
MKPLALITGVGLGTGSSLARRFAAAGYRTALIARNPDRLNALTKEIPDSVALHAMSLTQTPRQQRLKRWDMLTLSFTMRWAVLGVRSAKLIRRSSNSTFRSTSWRCYILHA